MSRPRSDAGARLRHLPSVESLLQRPGVSELAQRFGRESLLAACRGCLDNIREKLRIGDPPSAEEFQRDVEALPEKIVSWLERSTAPSLVPAINATGIIIHTNLGRAPLSPAAIDAIQAVASGYCNLEMDLERGERGSRHRHASSLLDQMFPHHHSLVVNNAAAGVLLALNTLAANKEVIISRGELVEIGGSFRIPSILERSGARLREVGTTNKTRIADYRDAITEDTGVILRVHPSNFRIIGFTEHATTASLAELGREHGIPVIEDFGSGNLASLSSRGLADEPWVSQTLHSGVDSVDLSIFSGDKLLGGPQAGILVGRSALVRECRENPMARALRADKLTYAALEATLSAHLRGKASEEIPVSRMIALPTAAIHERATRCQHGLDRTGFITHIEECTSMVGGGAGADASIPSVALALSRSDVSTDALAHSVRAGAPPILGRVSENKLLLDFRTVIPSQDDAVLARLVEIDHDAKQRGQR